jgi:hypothetical protein
VRRFVFNWSVTQHASVKEQLHYGVRFVFDKFKLQFNVIIICVCFQALIAGGMQVVSHLSSYTVLDSKFDPAYWWNKLTVRLITVRGCNTKDPILKTKNWDMIIITAYQFRKQKWLELF